MGGGVQESTAKLSDSGMYDPPWGQEVRLQPLHKTWDLQQQVSLS